MRVANLLRSRPIDALVNNKVIVGAAFALGMCIGGGSEPGQFTHTTNLFSTGAMSAIIFTYDRQKAAYSAPAMLAGAYAIQCLKMLVYYAS